MTISRIKTNSIEDSAVTGSKVATGGIATVDMADGSVTSLKIADGGVGTANIANSAVTPAKLSSDAQYMGFKNRIINGAMMIDQRNAGAAVTANGSYPVDRFFVSQNSSSSWSAQRSTTAPAGFVNSLAFTQTTGQAVSAGNITSINHRIEGFNVADLGWGTANAQPVTLSFWVRSSLTGTFGVSFINGAYNRSYVASYVINSANTWEYKTVTVAGDQSGTWATDNSRGLNIDWDLGVGTTFSNSAGSWAAGDYEGLTGGVKLAATTGATFYITGVQLEKGSTATSFDYRPYGTELALCQRYFYREVGSSGNYSYFATGGCYSSSSGRFYKQLPVTMRAAPTYTPAGSGYVDGVNFNVIFTLSALNSTQNAVRLEFTTASVFGAGQAVFLAQNTNANFEQSFSAEL